MSRKMCIAMKCESGIVSVNGVSVKPRLPEGCEGIAFIFASKKAAKEFYEGEKDLELLEIKRMK